MSGREVLEAVKASKRVTKEHVRQLRASLYNDGVAEAGEVDLLFAIDEAADDHDPAWCELFCEAVTDYLVDQVEPHGFVDDKNAEWLMARISSDGAVKTATELEVLCKVMEKARTSPARLSAFALNQVKKAVVDGEGPLAGGKTLSRGKVCRDEVGLMRRILYAFGSDGNIAVTRAEAEVLFDINDATADAANDPEWSELFVKAVANFVMAASGHAPPSRQEAMRREEWLDKPTDGVAGIFNRMAAGGLRGMLDAYREPGVVSPDGWAERNDRMAASVATAEVVTAEEAEWLAQRMGRDGALHENEKALLRFIRDEAPSVHPSLQTLITKAA